MGRHRKIPARKHHGIRDPLKQLATKENKLRRLINNPPTFADTQPESRRFAEFKKLAERAQAGKRIKRIQHGREDKPIEIIKPKSYRRIIRYPDESDISYIKRVNRITSESLREAQYSAKYGVDVVRDHITGVITIHKRPKNEIDELLKQKKDERRMRKAMKRQRKHQKKHPPPERMDRETIKELIKQAMKEDDNNDEDVDEDAYIDVEEYTEDPVKFGEVVHAPPTFTTLPKKAKMNETVSRPGRKDNLLLKKCFTATKEDASEPKIAAKKINKISATVTKEQLSGKMKNLPIATRAMLENERDKVMEIYRQNKAEKGQNLFQ